MPSRRDILKTATAFAVSAAPQPKVFADENKDDKKQDAFRIQRLSWAGVKLQYRDTTIFLDPLTNAAIWDGAWKLPIVPMEVATPQKFVLITHVHNDHFDPKAIREIGREAGVTVVCHESKASYVGSRGFRVYGTELYAPVTLGDFTVTPVPAVDGFNEYQVSWVVTNGSKRIIHCGDTLWHGGWWQVSQQQGPFDAAFLPINGAKFPQRKPFSDVEATMTPAHAVAAAVVLEAKLLVPIHYGLNDPASYLEHPNAVEELKSFAAKRNQPLRIMEPGDWVTI